jgi:hypothetical protein
MDEREIRMRCIEAAARNPDLRNAGGLVAGVLEAARQFEEFVTKNSGKTLGLPKK